MLPPRLVTASLMSATRPGRSLPSAVSAMIVSVKQAGETSRRFGDFDAPRPAPDTVASGGVGVEGAQLGLRGLLGESHAARTRRRRPTRVPYLWIVTALCRASLGRLRPTLAPGSP